MKSDDKIKQPWKFQEQSLKALNLLDEARRLKQSYSCDLCARRAQEAHEIFTKIMFLLIGKDPPKGHDLSQALYGVSSILIEHGLTEERVARLALGSKTLAAWRDLALYGDETLRVGRVFEEPETVLALKYAEEANHAYYAVQGNIAANLPN